jgi:hypothetical protein
LAYKRKWWEGWKKESCCGKLTKKKKRDNVVCKIVEGERVRKKESREKKKKGRLLLLLFSGYPSHIFITSRVSFPAFGVLKLQGAPLALNDYQLGPDFVTIRDKARDGGFKN